MDTQTLLSHADFVRNVVRGLLRDEHQVDDVVQDTMLTALKSPPRRRGALRAWLARVSRNRALTLNRGETRRRNREIAAARPETMPDATERLTRSHAVVEAVMALDEPYKTTVVERFFEGLPADVVAKRHGVSAVTVRTRVRGALKRLREHFDRRHGGSCWRALLLPLAATIPTRSAAAATAALIAGVLTMKTALFVIASIAAGVTIWSLTPSDHSGGRTPNRDAMLATDPEHQQLKQRAGDGAPSSSPRDEAAARARGTLLLRGILQDERKERVSGAVVTPGRWATPERWDAVAAPVRSAADGTFSLSIPNESGIGVVIRHPEYAPQRAWLKAAPAEPRVITLEQGVAFAARVLTSDFSPVDGAVVSVTHLKADGPWVVNVENPFPATTNEDGRADLGRVPLGVLRVRVRHADHPDRVVRFGIGAGADVEEEIILKTGGNIAGRVLDLAARPVAGARVQLREREDTEPVVTDAAGRFRLEGLPPGRYELLATAAGHGRGYFGLHEGWREPVPVPVRDRETTEDIEIVLPAAASVKGRVVDEKGKAVPGLRVSAWDDFEDVETETDDEGVFRVGPFGVTTGAQVNVSFDSERWFLANLDKVFVRPGEEADVGTLRAETWAWIAGRAVDADGRAIAEARVLAPSNVSFVRGGTFRMRVRPGAFTLRGEAELGGAPALAYVRVDVAPGAQQSVKLAFRRGATIVGRVITPDGAPRSRVRVMAVPATGAASFGLREHTSAYSGDDGVFSIPVPAGGKYRVGIFERLKDNKARLRGDPPPVVAEPGDPPTRLVFPRTGGVVSGRVLSAVTREPVPVFSARLVQHRDGLPWDSYEETVENDEGRFELDSAPSGFEYVLEVRAKGHGRFRSATFRMETGKTVRLKSILLRAPGAVAGVVTDAVGKPVALAQVLLVGPHFGTNLNRPRTDMRGRFAPIPFAAGAYTLVTFAPNRPLGIVRGVQIRENETTRVEVTLPAPAPVVVTVRGPDGQPVAGAVVRFTMKAIAPLTSDAMRRLYVNSYPEAQYETDANGELRIGFLPPGEVTFTAGGVRSRATLVAHHENRTEIRLDR